MNSTLPGILLTARNVHGGFDAVKAPNAPKTLYYRNKAHLTAPAISF
jgi:hypothetical protein